MDIVTIRDMDMQAYSHTVSFFMNYYNETAMHALRKGPKVECVKVACDGDRRVLDAPNYEAVQVPRSHPIFDGKGTASMISQVGSKKQYSIETG